MKRILSIQSHVAYGYVGNRAAVFPLQRLGHDVIVVNTVEFSNHTGYGVWEGDVLSRDHIARVLKGVKDRGGFNGLNGYLTGYMGDSALGELMLETAIALKQQNPNLIYCCDPVFGDTGRGIFAKPGIPEFFKDQLIQYADILTPNLFELSHLYGKQLVTLEDTLKACDALIKKDHQIILVTSLEHEKTQANTIEMLVYTRKKTLRMVTPKLFFETPPNGSGDLTAALFLAHYLESNNINFALEQTANAVYAVFEKLKTLQQRELPLIAAQDQLVNPASRFRAQSIKENE